MMIFKCILFRKEPLKRKTRKTNFGLFSPVFSKTHICRLFYDLSRSVSPDDMMGPKSIFDILNKNLFYMFSFRLRVNRGERNHEMGDLISKFFSERKKKVRKVVEKKVLLIIAIVGWFRWKSKCLKYFENKQKSYDVNTQ